MQLSHEVNWVKTAICNLRNSRLTIDSVGVYHFFTLLLKISYNFQGVHPYIVNL